MKKKIKVMIVDDSAIVRQALTEIFNSDPELEVMCAASNPYAAVKKIKDEVPDVISLDIEMPGMDGLTFLKKLMAQHPIPVVVISTLSVKGSDIAMRALAYGAVDVMAKPQLHTQEFLYESSILLCDAIKAAHHAKPKRKITGNEEERRVSQKLSVDAVVVKTKAKVSETANKIIAIGASTGGIDALREFLEHMPVDCPGIVITQHLPANFVKSFADRMNEICKIEVKEAEDGDLIMNGRALIAPGGRHMLVVRTGAHYKVKIVDGPLVNRHRPSVDVLFRSTAQNATSNAIGIILTGMGDDGAKGLLEMREAGAFTIAQDEESCVVFGMPKEAIKLGAAERVLPLHAIASHVTTIHQYLREKSKNAG
jgi:two-component system chemotaxis response regulator CheB